ncbi:MAG: TVP38/TMEM64 family protein, partial [Clostridia bacterium]|nr:TVP38/TMEM64 family protein [Clostridia bacterium]
MKKESQNKSLLLKLVCLGLLAAAVVLVMIRFAPQLIALAKNPQQFADYLHAYGFWGYVIFILCEVLQVIIALIPGDMFHISAGFIYGMPLGFLLAYFGEVLGALIAFGLAKYFGTDIVKKFVSEERIQKTSQLLNSAKGSFGILILCLIPAIPKDILIYVAGITPVKPLRFLTIFLLCRIPDIFIKSSGGSVLYAQNYT